MAQNVNRVKFSAALLVLVLLGACSADELPGLRLARDADRIVDAYDDDGGQKGVNDTGISAVDAAAFDTGVIYDAGIEGDAGASADVPDVSCDVVATNEVTLRSAVASAQPGTTVCLQAREWIDLTLTIEAYGTPDAPVIIAAQRAGETSLTGDVAIKLGGQHVIVTGLVIRRGQSAGSHLIDFRANGVECSRCRLTNVAVVELNDSGDTKWVSIRGQYNRVDHCSFFGKANDGALMVVWRPNPDADYHRIDHNYFAERPPLGRNGAETIRVGTSAEAQSSSFTVVEDNFFFRSNGEIEVISNKSSDNIYRRNVFQQSAGLLTLRHGNRCAVEQNIFLLEGVNGGGIRVVGSGHRIANNYVEGCRTTSNVRGGIVLMASDETPSITGYQQVEDIEILHNTVVDCEQSIVFGGGARSVAPRRVLFAGNLIDSRATGSVVRQIVALDEPTYAANLFFGGALGMSSSSGFFEANPQFEGRSALMLRISAESPAKDGTNGSFGVVMDIDGDTRDARPDIGADEVGLGPTRSPVTPDVVGTTFDSEQFRLR